MERLIEEGNPYAGVSTISMVTRLRLMCRSQKRSSEELQFFAAVADRLEELDRK